MAAFPVDAFRAADPGLRGPVPARLREQPKQTGPRPSPARPERPILAWHGGWLAAAENRDRSVDHFVVLIREGVFAI
jgi:hypothetical protein